MPFGSGFRLQRHEGVVLAQRMDDGPVPATLHVVGEPVWEHDMGGTGGFSSLCQRTDENPDPAQSQRFAVDREASHCGSVSKARAFDDPRQGRPPSGADCRPPSARDRRHAG
jgi:hypothetical protein